MIDSDESNMKVETQVARARNMLNVQTLLPPQKVTLGVTENKIQLIELICQYIKDQCHMSPSTSKLVVTAQDPEGGSSYNTKRGRCHYRSTLKMECSP